jgi:hypothetical protein
LVVANASETWKTTNLKNNTNNQTLCRLTTKVHTNNNQRQKNKIEIRATTNKTNKQKAGRVI